MERSDNIQVNTGIKIVYHITLVVSMLVGFWHFFVPNLYKWYDYLPMQYENLMVGIDYTNLCFSALLFGSSFVLILLRKSILKLHFKTIFFIHF